MKLDYIQIRYDLVIISNNKIVEGPSISLDLIQTMIYHQETIHMLAIILFLKSEHQKF